MKKLHPDWVTKGLIDFEYKKYLLLAYLKAVSTQFEEKRLYPFLADLVFHYRNLVSIRDNKERVTKDFPKKLSKLDFEQFTLEYEKMVGDEACLDVISQILDFAIPHMQKHVRDGKGIYEMVEENLTIEPIGIVPIDLQEGYMFLYTEKQHRTRIYSYAVTLFERGDEKYRGIRTDFLEEFVPSITRTFESYKLQLIKQYRDLPNPATWLVSSSLGYPVEDTLLPIAKRSLVRRLASAGNA